MPSNKPSWSVREKKKLHLLINCVMQKVNLIGAMKSYPSLPNLSMAWEMTLKGSVNKEGYSQKTVLISPWRVRHIPKNERIFQISCKLPFQPPPNSRTRLPESLKTLRAV